MSGTTRVTVDVPDEWLARARGFASDTIGWGGPGHNVQTRIARLVVDAAPAPVEVTITLTADEAAELATHEFYREVREDPIDTIEDRVASRASAALRAQGYGS